MTVFALFTLISNIFTFNSPMRKKTQPVRIDCNEHGEETLNDGINATFLLPFMKLF